MAREIRIVRGPSVQGLTKQAASSKLTTLPGFPEGAEYAVENIDGRWIAAVVMPEKTAAPFPPGGDESVPAGPPTDGPPAPPSDEAGPPEGEEKPKGDKKEGPPKPGEDGKVSIESELAQVKDMLTHMMDALGLSSPADGMVPGADAGPMGPMPPGPPGPPHGGKPGDMNPNLPGSQGSDNKIHTVHERSLKPGEAPPGTTPVGAPAFASVKIADDHPFADAIRDGQKEIEADAELGDASVADAVAELNGLVEPYGYFVEDIEPRVVSGVKVASARIVRSR